MEMMINHYHHDPGNTSADENDDNNDDDGFNDDFDANADQANNKNNIDAADCDPDGGIGCEDKDDDVNDWCDVVWLK